MPWAQSRAPVGHRGFRRHFSPSRLRLVSAGALCVLAVLFQVRALWWSDASCWPLQQKWVHVGIVRSPSGPLEVWTSGRFSPGTRVGSLGAAPASGLLGGGVGAFLREGFGFGVTVNILGNGTV